MTADTGLVVTPANAGVQGEQANGPTTHPRFTLKSTGGGAIIRFVRREHASVLLTALSRLAVGALIAGAASACATAQARTDAAGAPLEIPDPPPRLVALPAEPIASDEPAPQIAEESKPARPPATPAAAPEPPTRATAKPGPPDKPASSTAPASDAPRPGLRPGGSEALTVQAVRESLDRTRRQVESLQPDKLNAADRAQFDTARRFLDLAAPALNAGNAVFAQYLVEKAETLLRPLKP